MITLVFLLRVILFNFICIYLILMKIAFQLIVTHKWRLSHYGHSNLRFFKFKFYSINSH